MKAVKLPEPTFKTDGIFTVTFLCRYKISGKSSVKDSGIALEMNWNRTRETLINKSPSKLGKSALKILEMVYRDKYITIPEMAKNLGITERRVGKNIQNLKALKLMKRKEGGRTGYWTLQVK